MKRLLMFFLLLFPILLIAQEQEILWLDSDFKKVPSQEQATYYRVTTFDNLTKHFTVEDYFVDGKPVRTGQFLTLKPEVRDGLFIWYFKNGKKNKSILYENNKVKHWTVWNEKNKVVLSVILSFKGQNGEDLHEAYKVDKEPQFPGGEKALKSFIAKNQIYPPVTTIDPIEGTVVVYALVDENGKLNDVRVVRPVHPDVDAESLRIVSLMPDWIPGEVNGKKVAVPCAIPVTFRNKSAQGFSRTRTTNPNR
jgi:TonB family protein